MAAIAMQGQCAEGDISSRAWSLCVYFEMYIRVGAEGTEEDFGPKEPVVLKAVK